MPIFITILTVVLALAVINPAHRTSKDNKIIDKTLVR